MRSLRKLRHRLRSLLRRGSLDQDLGRELDLHLEQLTREHMAAGLSEAAARLAARRAFGSAALVEDRCRDTRRVNLLTEAVGDARYAWRLLRRTPAFAVAAVLSIAFGVGANTAIFSLVDAVLLRTLPVERPHELVFFETIGSRDSSGAPPYPWFERVRQDTRTFAGMAVFASDEFRVVVDGRTEQVFAHSTSGSFFDVLGVKPVIGRLLTPADEKMAPPVAVIGYGYWQRRFAGSPDVLGKTITLGSRVYSVVGVTPPDFLGLVPGRRMEVTTPLAEDSAILKDGSAWWCDVVARLRPGATPAQASASGDAAFQAHMQTLTVDPELRQTHFHHVEVVPAARGLDRLRGRFSTPLRALMVLTLAVLLIACGNLGTLLLVRGEARARELAIRQAAGASGGRLLRQLFTETLLLFALGAVLGLVVAHFAVRALVGFFAIGRNAIELDAAVDWRAAAFAAAVALAAAILTGLWPALRALRVDPQDAMRSGDTRHGGSPRVRAAARVLIVAQLALCLTLLVSALLFATTMRNLRGVDLGFTPERVLTQSIDPLLSGPDAPGERAMVWTRVLERMQSLPGARAASLSILTPLSGRDRGTILSGPAVADRPVLDRIIKVNPVSEDYFRVFGMRLLQGRAFTSGDRTRRVAIVNETAQAELFAGRNPVGEILDFGKGRVYQIVGVVNDVRHRDLREPKARMAYLPLWQAFDALTRVTLSVATQQAPMTLAADVAREVRAIDASTLVSDVFDVEEQIDATLISERLLAALGTAFALLALGLAAIGVYGILSYSVAERRSEIALRMALGAMPARVGWEIWREVQWQIVAGLGLGLPAAWMTSRIVKALLFGVTPLDLATYAAAATVLVAVAVLAALLPMRRAASLNPSEVMRQ